MFWPVIIVSTDSFSDIPMSQLSFRESSGSPQSATVIYLQASPRCPSTFPIAGAHTCSRLVMLAPSKPPSWDEILMDQMNLMVVNILETALKTKVKNYRTDVTLIYDW